jgi:GNAT superfamily N-acetyltransferase
MYESYNPEHLQGLPPKNLVVREATGSDAAGVARINTERNKTDIELSLKRVSKELEDSAASEDFKVFVASVNSEITGFARCVHIDTTTTHVKFPSPPGWYGLGLVVRKDFRGQGIARALSNYRIEWLKGKAEYLHSFASSQNPVSLKMHKEFGFEEVTSGPGFLNVTFDCGKGILFRKKI